MPTKPVLFSKTTCLHNMSQFNSTAVSPADAIDGVKEFVKSKNCYHITTNISTIYIISILRLQIHVYLLSASYIFNTILKRTI